MRKLLSLLCLLVCCGGFLFSDHAIAQQPRPIENAIKIKLKPDSLSVNLYDDDLLSKEFLRGRREALRALMPDSSMAVFFANPVRNRSNDVDFEYHQDPNFYYLSGFEESNAVLIIFKEEQQFDSIKTNEILFVPERNPKMEVWTGKMRGTQSAMKDLGIKTAVSNDLFADWKMNYEKFKKVMWVPYYEDARDDKSDPSDTYSLMKGFKSKTKDKENVDKLRMAEYMARLREIKQPQELKLMRKTIDMTCEGFVEMIKAVEPGMREYQAEAIVEYFFQKNGAEFEGYPSICGAHENSVALHYSSNRRKLTGNELLVVDAGAEYHGYTADVTRTVPVSGTFSKEQKLIYNIVREAQQAGIDSCLKGRPFWAAHQAASKIIQKRLLELGIIKEENDFRKYFMHGTSHYLGLDVHDVGMYGPLQPGMIITVEPGIYIKEGSDCDPKWWNIGVRIEDDILITEGKPEVLSDCIPKKAEDIEALMKQESMFAPKKK